MSVPDGKKVRSVGGLPALLPLGLGLALFAACGGVDEEPSPGRRNAEPPEATPNGVPDTQLRRLTRTEYNNTIRDLLGDSTRPGDLLDADAEYNGFDNNAAMLRTNLPSVVQYDAVAIRAVEYAFRPSTPARTRILEWGKCGDAVTERCAREIIATFARKAWRRPVEPREVDGLAGAIGVAREQGDGVEEGVKLAFRMGLVSPNFLYRVEVDPPNATGMHRVTPHELATRLSYFLWSTMPDDELSARADDGSLTNGEVFAAQVDRMLADGKADALVDNFAAQWLSTRSLESVEPDAKVFPSFDDSLREALAAEPRFFFREFLKGDEPLTEMLETNFTFVNDRLAKHYGLPAVKGKELVKVAVDGTRRGGLLTHGAMLTATSLPNRTEIPRRGQWVLSRLLCEPVAPPPPDIPPLDVTGEGLPPNPTPRDFLKRHQKKGTSCYGCHVQMDAIGFAMEHYDGIGAWRDAYPNNAIDARGELPGGATFDGVNGANGLAGTLKKDPRFTQCVTKTVFGYALGRATDNPGDHGAVTGLVSELAKPERGNRVRELLALVATSHAFQFRGGQR